MRCIPLASVLCVACAGDPTSKSDSASPRQTVRGTRICELNELVIQDDMLGIRVWNDMVLHDCSDDWLAQIDREAYAVGGPRWRTLDEAVVLDVPATERVPQEVPPGLGHDMVEAATVSLVPLAAVEAQLGYPIESTSDLPALAREQLHDATLRSTGYRVAEVQRSMTTEFVHHSGRNVFVIDDGTCRYAMKYFTSVFDDTLVDEAAVASLADRLPLLPEGYSFSVETFETDLVITEDQGTQYVMTDELGNSYDRFACD